MSIEISEDLLNLKLKFLNESILNKIFMNIGYEQEEITNNYKTKDEMINRMICDIRELGIENFMQRLQSTVTNEICSMLEFSSANSSSDKEMASQLESHIKESESLESFFYSLTPYLLNQICCSLGIKIPNLPESMHPKPITKENQRIPRIEKSSHVLVATPILHMDPIEGKVVISTISNKSSFRKFKNSSKELYGDGAIEGQLYDTIIENLKKEILLSGSESLFSLQDTSTLYNIFKILQTPDNYNNNNINTNITTSSEKLITSLIDFLFNIKEQNSNSNSTNKNNSNNNNNNSNEFEEEISQIYTPYKVNLNRNSKNEIENDEENDSDIDRPASRPIISNIKEGITKQQLEDYLQKDLKLWLTNKKLKSSGTKTECINRILEYFDGSIPIIESTNEPDENINQNNKRTKNHKDIMLSKKLKESRHEEEDEIMENENSDDNENL